VNKKVVRCLCAFFVRFMLIVFNCHHNLKLRRCCICTNGI
jgi:hypothetical protein